MTPDRLDLEELERLLQRERPGGDVDGYIHLVASDFDSPMTPGYAEFTAATINALPALIAAARRAARDDALAIETADWRDRWHTTAAVLYGALKAIAPDCEAIRVYEETRDQAIREVAALTEGGS